MWSVDDRKQKRSLCFQAEPRRTARTGSETSLRASVSTRQVQAAASVRPSSEAERGVADAAARRLALRESGRLTGTGLETRGLNSDPTRMTDHDPGD